MTNVLRLHASIGLKKVVFAALLKESIANKQGASEVQRDYVIRK